MAVLRLNPKDLKLEGDCMRLLHDVRRELNTAKSLALVLVNGQVLWPASQFLSWMGIRSASTTGDTARTYAEGLQIYLQYLTTNAIDVADVTEWTLQSYRNWLVNREPGEKKLAGATINLRLTIAMAFHLWCERRGMLLSKVGLFYTKSMSPSSIRTTATSRQKRPALASTVKIRNQSRLPRIISRDELSVIIDNAGPLYGLMFKWAVTTGMRRFEICDLKISDLPLPEGGRKSRLRELTIYRKGGKKSTVFLPNALVEETWTMIWMTRPNAHPSTHVFMSVKGLPVQREALSKIFKQSCLRVVAGATLHHLRHTYAVTALNLLQKRAVEGDSINPLKTLQVMMGHASIETTEIYLRALDVRSDAVERTLYYLYGGELEIE